MLRISWQTLRSRRGALTGAFVAIWLAVTLAYATGLLMSGALGAPGPGRFAAADAVVRADPTVRVGDEPVDVVPAPRLSAAAVARAESIPGVERAVGDVSFPAGVWDAGGRRLTAERLRGHGWQSAALTPYRLTAGQAPSRPRDVVVDARLGVRAGDTVRVVAPGGDAPYRVSGVAAGSADEVALFFAPAVAGTLSGAPGVDAIGVVGASPAELRGRMGEGVEVLDAEHASAADAGDPTTADREALVAIFGTMAGIAGTVALFVVAGTFALAIAQRRRETAVLRALGATPRQVRRLIAGEALIVSLAATALGVLTGRPLALAIVDLLVDRGVAPEGFALGSSLIPLAAAVGAGIGIAQLAVVAAARRAGRVRPAEALREVAIEHGRPGVFQLLSGVLCLGGGVAMAIIFTGEAALAFSILGGILLASGTAMLGRWLLGLPAAALSLPLRLLGAPGLLASTGLAANRWRTAALATPVVLIAMLVGTQGVLQASSQEDTERVTEARVTADRVVVGADGAPLPAGTAGALARLPGVRAAAGMLPTELFLLDDGLGWDTPWPAAGLPRDADKALDLDVTAGSLGDVGGRAVAISSVVAAEGDLRVGDPLRARMADTRAETLRVAAVYDRAARARSRRARPRARPPSRRHGRRRSGLRRGRLAVGRRLRGGPSRRRRADPGRVPRHPARRQQRPGVGHLDDRRAVGRVRRARAAQHRRHGHRRAPRRARDASPAGRDAVAGDADDRPRAGPGHARRARGRRGDRRRVRRRRAGRRPRHPARHPGGRHRRPARGDRPARPRRRRGQRADRPPRLAAPSRLMSPQSPKSDAHGAPGPPLACER